MPATRGLLLLGAVAALCWGLRDRREVCETGCVNVVFASGRWLMQALPEVVPEVWARAAVSESVGTLRQL